MIFCLLQFCGCQPEKVDSDGIQGLWVIAPESKVDDYMEFAILGDSIFFQMPVGHLRSELFLKKNSMKYFNSNKYIYFKINDEKDRSSMLWDNNGKTAEFVDFVRPTFLQLKIDAEKRMLIYMERKLPAFEPE